MLGAKETKRKDATDAWRGMEGTEANSSKAHCALFTNMTLYQCELILLYNYSKVSTGISFERCDWMDRVKDCVL